MEDTGLYQAELEKVLPLVAVDQARTRRRLHWIGLKMRQIPRKIGPKVKVR